MARELKLIGNLIFLRHLFTSKSRNYKLPNFQNWHSHVRKAFWKNKGKSPLLQSLYYEVFSLMFSSGSKFQVIKQIIWPYEYNMISPRTLMSPLKYETEGNYFYVLPVPSPNCFPEFTMVLISDGSSEIGAHVFHGF